MKKILAGSVPIPASGGTRTAHYSEATAQTFRRALDQLAKFLPAEHARLVELVDDGRFHDATAIIAVLDGGDQ